ncbi:hypothetical protein shim_21960 [Shimia sp. SK013]|nr:hypothetical protein shim_21960 [Shimia sp. SK013]
MAGFCARANITRSVIFRRARQGHVAASAAEPRFPQGIWVYRDETGAKSGARGVLKSELNALAAAPSIDFKSACKVETGTAV